MSEQILEGFPEWRNEILKLLQEDPKFQEMCADYEEVSTWLAASSVSAKRPDAKYDEARQLLKSLEEEILETLKATRKLNPSEE